MSLKEQVLDVLISHRGEDISGQDLADRFHVSRAAVWKAIRILKEEGHLIEAGQNRGYRLLQSSDVLSEAAIAPLLNAPLDKTFITVVKECSSTNDFIKQCAAANAPSGTCIIADRQISGRGRQGRTFYSPSGGLYLSMLFRPSLLIRESAFITIAAAVAVCRAVKKVCNISLEIKWVNDLFLNGKKVGGILTEAAADLEGGMLEYAIVGIGLNISFDETLPEEINAIAGALYEKKPPKALRCELAAAILNELYELEQSPASSLEQYRTLSFLPGRMIKVVSGVRTGMAKALAITDEGCLLVEYEDHTQIALNSGEVHIVSVE